MRSPPAITAPFWVNVYACTQRLALSVQWKHDDVLKAEHWASQVVEHGGTGPLYRVKVDWRANSEEATRDA